MKEKIGIKGQVKIELFDKDHKLKQVISKKNLIVYNGYNFIRQCLSKSASRPVVANYLSIGSGVTAATRADTGMESELARKLATYTEAETDTGYKDQWKLDVMFSGGEGTGTVSESGILNDVSGGVLFCRTTFTGIVKAGSDELAFEWTFTVS